MYSRFSIQLLIGFVMTLILAHPSYSQNHDEPETKASCCSSGKPCLHNSSMNTLCQKSCAVQNYDPDDLVSPAKASIGDLTRCPVSGVVFRVTQFSPMVKFEDKEIYTCCGSCETIYNHDPEKYAAMIRQPKV